MGALEINACGRRAQRLCARSAGQDDPGARAIDAACHEARIS
jgi:hypothetical protein